MTKIKIKYCGLRTIEDVETAIEAQADSIGLVLVKKSPRCITPDEAMPLAKYAQSAGLVVVALFADNSADEVNHAIESFQPDVLQFHGSESAAFCEQFNWVYWKAVPMLAVEDYQVYMAQYPNATAFLLDAFGGQKTGGSGTSFHWFQFPELLKPKLILAGGIDVLNVADALMCTGAQYIDTSSGIESSPGVKSKTKMLALKKRVDAINSTNQNNNNNNKT